MIYVRLLPQSGYYCPFCKTELEAQVKHEDYHDYYFYLYCTNSHCGSGAVSVRSLLHAYDGLLEYYDDVQSQVESEDCDSLFTGACDEY